MKLYSFCMNDAKPTEDRGKDGKRPGQTQKFTNIY